MKLPKPYPEGTYLGSNPVPLDYEASAPGTTQLADIWNNVQ